MRKRRLSARLSNCALLWKNDCLARCANRSVPVSHGDLRVLNELCGIDCLTHHSHSLLGLALSLTSSGVKSSLSFDLCGVRPVYLYYYYSMPLFIALYNSPSSAHCAALSLQTLSSLHLDCLVPRLALHGVHVHGAVQWRRRDASLVHTMCGARSYLLELGFSDASVCGVVCAHVC